MAIRDIYNGLRERGGESLFDSNGVADTASINSIKDFLSYHPELRDVTNRMKDRGGEGITRKEYDTLAHYIKLYDMRDTSTIDTVVPDSDVTRQKSTVRKKNAAEKAVEFGFDVGRDLLATGVKAAGSTVKGIGQIPAIVAPSLGDNIVSKFGEGIHNVGSVASSPWLKEQEANYQDQARGEGFVDEMKNTASALANNPGAAAEMIASGASFMLPIAGAGRFVGAVGAARAASKASKLSAAARATRIASAANRAAGLGGIAMGAALQGGGTASDTYDQIMSLPDEVIMSNDEAKKMARSDRSLSVGDIKKSLANKYGRMAGVASAGSSLLFQKLFPLTEKAVSGITQRVAKSGADAASSAVKSSVKRKIAKTAIELAKEQAGEIGEEVSGKISQNVASAGAGANVAWNEGLGRTVVETAAVTPMISIAPAAHEAGFDPTKIRSKAASRRDGTFSRTRSNQGEIVESPREKIKPVENVVEPTVEAEPPQVLTPEGTPPESLPVSTETPVNPVVEQQAPVTETVAETPTKEVANGEEEGQGRGGLLKPSSKFDGVPDNEISVEDLTLEEARDLINSRPKLSSEENRAARRDRNSLRHLLDRKISWLTRPKKGSDTTYKDRNQADSDVRHEVSAAKKAAKSGDLDAAKTIFDKMSDKYKIAYGDQAEERMKQHWDIVKKSIKTPRTEDAGVKSNQEIKSIPDAQKIVNDLESKFGEWIANGSEPDIIDSYEVYKKAVTSLYPEGNKAQEYIDAKKAELSAKAPVAPEPTVERETAVVTPKRKSLAEELADIENALINENIEELSASDQAALESEMNSEPAPQRVKSSAPIESPIVSETSPVKVRVKKDMGDSKPGTRVVKMIKDLAGKVKVTVGSNQGVYKINGLTFDFTGSFKGPEASAGIWSDIFSDPEIVSRVRDGLTKMGDAGKSTLDKMNDVADLLLDENGNPTPWASVVSDLFERDRDFEDQADSDETGLNFIFSDVALTQDDLAALQSIFEPKTVRLGDFGSVMILGAGAILLGLAGYGAYTGYKKSKKAAIKIQKGIADLLNDPVFHRHTNAILPPQMVIQNACRNWMKGPKEKADAGRKLSNVVNDFIRWTSMKKTQLMNLYKPHADIPVEDIEKYSNKYRQWVEVDKGDVNHPDFVSLPSHIRDAFIAFKQISEILGAELKEQGGSPREHWAPRIHNNSAVRAVSSEANKYIGSMAGEQITNMNKTAWKNILAKVPADSPLRRAINSAVNDPVSGILHGFIDANGNPTQNTSALPNYLKHEVVVDSKKSIDDYTPLFPALMEYKVETRKIGDDDVTVLVPRVKAHTLISVEKDAGKRKEMIDELKQLIEAEALRCISEMHDFEYNGGRGSGFANPAARDRFFRTDGSLINGREMPYLGDEMYIHNPWETIPQIIHRQTMGLGRWKFFGRQKEKLSPILAPLIEKRGEFDRLLGLRKPKTSNNIGWLPSSDNDYNGSLAQAITDVAMGYHASKPLFGKDNSRFYDSYSWYSNGIQYVRNAVTKAQLDGLMNALKSLSMFGMLRVKSGTTVLANEAAGPVGEALMRGMGSALSNYPMERLKYSLSSEAEKRDTERGNSDASSRSSVTKMERFMDRYAKHLGQFDQSVSQMDLTARKIGEIAFHEMLMLYADARDLDWDRNATNNKDLMDRAMSSRTDMELLYSPEELDRAIEIMDNLGPENYNEFNDIAGKFSYEYAKYLSGSSDMSARSGAHRSWLFNNTGFGFLAGTMISIMMHHINSLYGNANLTGRTRKEKIKSYAFALPVAGAVTNLAKTSYFGSLMLSSLLTRAYTPLAINTGLAAAIGIALYGENALDIGAAFDSYNPVAQARARSEFINTARNLNPGNWEGVSDAMMPAKFLLGSAFTGLPYGGRMFVDALETSSDIDQKVGGFSPYSPSIEKKIVGMVPTVMYPVNAGASILSGLSTAGSSLVAPNPMMASADRRYGAAKILGSGGILSPHIGDLSSSGRNLTTLQGQFEALQRMNGTPTEAATEQMQRNKVIRGR